MLTLNRRPPSYFEAAHIPLNLGDTCSKVQVTVPVSALQPLDSGWPQAIQTLLLETKYRDSTLQDAMTTGNTWTHEVTGEVYLRSNLNEASFKGFVFEAAVARLVRENIQTIGK